jgi:hypothetical protein
MAEPVLVDLFAEDRGHEELLCPLIQRMAREQNRTVDLRVRSARGGHGRAIEELKLYQRSMKKGVSGDKLPDLVVVAIDSNCKSYTETAKEIQQALEDEFRDRAVCACPDPHVERWYMADLDGFQQVVGVRPAVGKQKCERDVYKRLLAQAVVDAGHPATLGGIEFARELADAMDFYRAGKVESALKHFLDETTARLKRS